MTYNLLVPYVPNPCSYFRKSLDIIECAQTLQGQKQTRINAVDMELTIQVILKNRGHFKRSKKSAVLSWLSCFCCLMPFIGHGC